jgi:hypothetical protein
MSDSAASSARAHRLAHLPSCPQFRAASAEVEQALNGLRDAERALERQLSDLRRYRGATANIGPAPIPDHIMAA